MAAEQDALPPSEAAIDYMRAHLTEEHGRDFDPERDLSYAGNAPAGAILTHRAETAGSAEGFWCSLCPGRAFLLAFEPGLTEERIAHLARLDRELESLLGEVEESERTEIVEAHEERKSATALLRHRSRRARLRQRAVQPEAQRRREGAQRYLLASYEELGNVAEALDSLLELQRRDPKAYRKVMGTDKPYALTATAFDRIMDGLEKNAAILATDDLGRQDPDETRINPAGGKVIETQPTRAKSLERPFLGMFLGRIAGADVAPIDRVTKTAYTSNGNLISAHIVEGDLRVSGLSALEVQMGLRIRSGGLPKSFAEM